MIYDNFRATGAHDTVLGYVDSFSITLRNDNVQDFDTRWFEILWSMTKIPSGDVLGSLYKLKIGESDQLKIAQEMNDMEIHHKISKPKLSEVEDDGEKDKRSKNFDHEIFVARNEKIETGAVFTSLRRLSDIEIGKRICYKCQAKRSVFERRTMQFPTRES